MKGTLKIIKLKISKVKAYKLHNKRRQILKHPNRTSHIEKKKKMLH